MYYCGIDIVKCKHEAAVEAVLPKRCNTIYAILREDRPRQPIPPKDKV